jgi:hypothetical protein
MRFALVALLALPTLAFAQPGAQLSPPTQDQIDQRQHDQLVQSHVGSAVNALIQQLEQSQIAAAAQAAAYQQERDEARAQVLALQQQIAASKAPTADGASKP